MARRRKSVWRALTASVAAFLLVLQMVVGSMALAGEISPRDALGGVICFSHPDESAPVDQPGGHKLPSCCMLGCNLFSSGLLPAASGAPFEHRLESSAEPIGVESDVGPFARPETHPRNPRAPPLQA